MKAPIANFYEEIENENIEVHCCGQQFGNQLCAAHIVRAINIDTYRIIEDQPTLMFAAKDNCINVFVKPVPPTPNKPGWIAVDIDKAEEGTKVYCHKCENEIGSPVQSYTDYGSVITKIVYKNST